MQEYKCIVKNSEGKTIKNHKIKAEDELELIEQLKAADLYLIHFETIEVTDGYHRRK